MLNTHPKSLKHYTICTNRFWKKKNSRKKFGTSLTRMKFIFFKFRTSLTHFENFQTALKSPILKHFWNSTWKNISMSLNMLEEAVVIWRHIVVNQKICVFVKFPFWVTCDDISVMWRHLHVDSHSARMFDRIGHIRWFSIIVVVCFKNLRRFKRVPSRHLQRSAYRVLGHGLDEEITLYLPYNFLIESVSEYAVRATLKMSSMIRIYRHSELIGVTHNRGKRDREHMPEFCISPLF